MKKTLWLLPLAALMIISCKGKGGGGETPEPSNTEEIPTSIPDAEKVEVLFYSDFTDRDISKVYARQVAGRGRKLQDPGTPAAAPHAEFPRFMGWSLHEVVNDESELWNFATDKVTTTDSRMILYGIWWSEESPDDPVIDPTDEPNAGYGFRFGNGTFLAGTHVGENDGFDQYLIAGVSFSKDQTFTLINFESKATWVVAIDGWSFGGASADDTKWESYLRIVDNAYKVVTDFEADVYLKFKYEADQVYFGPVGSGEETGETGFGIRYSDGTTVAGAHTGEHDGFDQYFLAAHEFKEGAVFSLYNFANEDTWVIPVDGWSFGGRSADDTKWQSYLSKGDGSYTVLQGFKADVYIKLKYQADQIYFGLVD